MNDVVVVGSANVDLQAEVDHLPARGETVLGGRLRTAPGGKGANQAIAAHRLGTRTHLVCAVGDDLHADTVLSALEAEGLGTDGVRRVPEEATGVAMIVVAHDGENHIVVAPGANAALTPDDVDRLAGPHLDGGPVVVLQLEIAVDTALAAARLAQRRGASVVLNCAPMPADPATIASLLATVDVLVVNESEAGALLGDALPDDESSWREAAQRLRAHGPVTVVVTLGARGAAVATDDGTFLQPAFTVDPVDTTGAGDAFCAALAVGLAAGEPIDRATERACAAGALATTRPGAQTSPTPSEVDRLLAMVGVV